jgi:hypothetical protein
MPSGTDGGTARPGEAGSPWAALSSRQLESLPGHRIAWICSLLAPTTLCGTSGGMVPAGEAGSPWAALFSRQLESLPGLLTD